MSQGAAASNKSGAVEATQGLQGGGEGFVYLLKALSKYGASDLHMKVGRAPLFRIAGNIVSAKMHPFSEEILRSMFDSVMKPEQRELLKLKRQVDVGFQVDGLGRFRLNIFFQKGTLAGVVRMIPLSVPTLDQLGLPLVLKKIAGSRKGLVVVTGSTGSGKSTTLAAMISYLNENFCYNIITIEDPIEFVYSDKKCSIVQRELGDDATSAKEALMGALRQDPDVILLGELRDTATIEAALVAAETGHLVMATLHTDDAISTIDRIIDVFPAQSQNQVRVSLASSLQAVVAQRLIPRLDQKGRVAACEIMIKSPSIAEMIREGKVEHIEGLIADSKDFYGMQNFNQHLEELIQKGLISKEEAMNHSSKPEELRMRLDGLRKEEGY